MVWDYSGLVIGTMDPGAISHHLHHIYQEQGLIGAIDLRGHQVIIFGGPVVELLPPETVGGVTTSGDRKRIRGMGVVAKDNIGVGLQQNLEAN